MGSLALIRWGPQSSQDTSMPFTWCGSSSGLTHMPLDSRVLAASKRTGGRLQGTPDLQQSLLIPCLCPEAFSEPQRGMQCGDLPPESLPRVWLPESRLGSLSSLLPTGKKTCPCHMSLVTSSHCPSPHDPPPFEISPAHAFLSSPWPGPPKTASARPQVLPCVERLKFLHFPQTPR